MERAAANDATEPARDRFGKLRDGRLAVQRFESSELAMRNLRLDLIKLRTGGIGALNDVTSATQQARAISRDVENLTAAASEVREAMG